VRQVFTAVEQQLAEERRSLQDKASSPRERVKLMMDENRRRRELRNEQLKAVMSPAQYESFLQSQADSTESDIEIFHGAG
jgi:regulator of replication initiation timing